MTPRPKQLRRRGSLLVELAMGTALFTIAMTLTVKILGTVAVERRAAERRQQALLEVGNLMERITAYPYDELSPDLAKRLSLSPAARAALPHSELGIDISPVKAGKGTSRSSKRIALVVRWQGGGGEWVAPVRLVSWVEKRGDGR